MAVDATGTPTSLGIPTYNTPSDKPSGQGFNAAMAVLDTLLITANKTPVTKAGSAVGTRRGINFIEGSGIALTVADNSGSDRVDVTVAVSGSGVPTGAIMSYAGTAAPAGWAMCDGSAVARTGGTYDALFAVISTTYGSGNGTTTFNLPDLKGRVPVGKGANADVSSLANSDSLADANRSPKHNSTNNLSASGSTAWAWDTGTGGLVVRGSGSGGGPATQSLSISIGGTIGPGGSRPTDTPAYLVINYIIKL